MMFADTLMANGQTDYVKKYLWTGDSNVYMGGAIKRDLDYIVSGYSSDTCDLWEEIRSTNFFWNRFTMKKAMGLGADFAARMGDSTSSSNYKSTEQRINSTLYADHWSGYVYESTSRTKVMFSSLTILLRPRIQLSLLVSMLLMMKMMACILQLLMKLLQLSALTTPSSAMNTRLIIYLCGENNFDRLILMIHLQDILVSYMVVMVATLMLVETHGF